MDAGVASSVRDWVAQRVLSDPQRAFEIARTLRDVANQSTDPEAKAHGWRCFGDASLYQGRFHEARDAYDLARDLAREAGTGGLLGQILVAQIGVLSTQGRADAAALLAPEAEALLEGAGDRPYLARLHMNLGNAAFHRHQYREAYEHFSRADREFTALRATDGMTLGLRINLGVVTDAALSRVEEARRIFLSVEEDCARLGLHHLEAQAKFNRARLESLWGNYREAISLLETAEAMFAKEDAPDLMAGTQLTRAEAFVDLGMPDEAIDLAHKAGETYRACELELDAAVADEVRARALRSEGRTTEARRLLDGVRDFYERSELPVGVALTDLEIARMVRAHADLVDAEGRSVRSLQVLEAQGLTEPCARGEIVLAETFRRMGSQERAEEVAARAIARTSQLNTRTRIDLWTVAGRIARDSGRRYSALRRYRRAMAEGGEGTAPHSRRGTQGTGGGTDRP
ncbi:MAG: tetratricopeptide repeat protein [Candidatus Eisenbacteria bacterium]